MPPKRKRGVSNAAQTQPKVVVDDADSAPLRASPDGAEDPEPDEPASTTKSSKSTQSHKRQNSKPIPTTKAAEGTPTQKAPLVAVNGSHEARMEEPPKAGLVDPAGGYKTNPPPTDRVVRVYADGVFDLFHLG